VGISIAVEGGVMSLMKSQANELELGPAPASFVM
jgi:hypothetical protein